MTRQPVLFATLVSILALSLTEETAAEYLSKERGLTADTAYTSGDIDHVNLFNGNLSITIPIGQQYPLGPSLSYGLVLSYNSNIWDYRPYACFDPVNNISVEYALPSPTARSNAGTGWELHLGRLFSPNQEPWNDSGRWVFVASDGSQHTFYNELHPGSGTQANTQFTNDGSYLRMRHFQAGDTKCKPVTGDDGTCRLVESPDGSVREFRNFIGTWKLTRLRDAFGNWLDIAYGAASWVLSDVHGRTHTVNFTSNHVSAVELAGPGGSTVTYTPAYTPANITRQGYFKPDCAPAAHGEDVSVLQLTGLSQPDDTYWTMGYATDWLDDSLSGGIREMRTPSGGGADWTYQTYPFLGQVPEFGQAWMNQAQGVATRTLTGDPSDPAARATWTYDYAALGNTPDPGFPAISCFHRQRVIDPVGNTTDYFFSTLRSIHEWSFGLPFTYCDPGTGAISTSGPFLSEQWYQGGASPSNLKRSIWVEYTADGTDLGDSDQESNVRMVHRKEIFHDDGDKVRETLRSDFDGLGHFRERLVRGDFGPEKLERVEYLPAGTLLLDPETSLPLPGNNFVMPTGDIWLFGLSSEQTLTQRTGAGDPGTTSKTQTCFAPNGFLLRTRALAGASAQGHDTLSVMVSEVTGSPGRWTGFVAEDRVYGGDQAAEPLGPGELCTLTLPGEPEFWAKTSFSAGVASRSVVVEPCDGTTEVLQTSHQLIDASTGLPTKVFDSADFGVSLTYDSMGRLIREDPDAGAARLHLHVVPALGASVESPSYQVEMCDPSVGGQDCPNDSRRFSSRTTYFDGLGRPTSEAIAYPAAGNSQLDQSRSFEHDALGRTTFESTWQQPLGTTISGYDRFGRASQVQPSGEDPVKLTYVGERKATRELKVATSLTGTASIFTTETRDHFGRLVAVCENQTTTPTTEACGGLLTTYRYDQDDRILGVCHAASGTTCGQERKFTYDNRGFLTAAQQPEIGRTTADWTRYSYDALGHVLTKDIDGNNDIPISLRYDRAGRLTKVSENDGGLRPIKEFFYARENVEAAGPFAKDWRAGKLFQARRHNWVQAVAPLPEAPGDVVGIVTDTFEYKGLGGRVSSKQTSLRLLSGTTSFRSSYSHDLLGQVNSILYPRCNDWPCYGNDPVRQVSFNRKLGFLQQIPGYATFDYQLGGSLLHHIQIGNGIVWEQQTDPQTALARPSRILTKNGNGTELWNTGAYDYDGAGNIRAIGLLAYQYDGFGRLVKEAQGATTRQQATYDNFGNITNLTTAGSSFPIPVSSTTNRLGGTGTTYRADGSLSTMTAGGEPFAYTFDGLGQMKYLQSQSEARVFFYDASDDRLLAWDCPTNNCQASGSYLRWTVRGLSGEVLRSYDETRRDDRRWLEDFVYQNGRLLAATRRNESGGEDRFAFALDHLGSTRQVYNWNGSLAESHTFYPFGQEVAAPGVADFKHKFTGHERDQNDSGMGMLDYMRARYHSPVVGRFLAVDPAGASPMQPQSWNRYSYVLNRPTVFRDPKGLTADLAFFFTDLCLVQGLCTDHHITVTAPGGRMRFSKILMKFYGFPTYGSEGKGILGNSPDATLFSFEENLEVAEQMGIGDMGEFYRKVRTGGEWDIKQLCPSSAVDDLVPCQHFGNYHFGVLAGAAGIPLLALLGGAGVHQVIGNGGESREEWIWPNGWPPMIQPPFGDDPKDQAFITMGWIDYQKFKEDQ